MFALGSNYAIIFERKGSVNYDGKTHASCGLLVGAWTTQYYQTDIFTTVTVMCLATMASLLPDICHMRSKIGRRLKLISFIIRLLFGHRTFTHSLIFVFNCICACLNS